MDGGRARRQGDAAVTEPAGPGTVLLVGAGGKLGRATVPRLVEAGWHVRAMSRSPGALSDLASDRVTPVGGDLRDPSTLASACAGADAVVAAAHAALGNHGANRPATVDRDGNRNLVEAAKAAGGRRFVYVSASGAAPDHPIDFFRFKAEAASYVRDSGLPFVILEPGPFMETWAELVGKPVLEKGRAVLLGDTKKTVNYVSVRDVARFVEIALRDDSMVGQAVRLGGPENLSVDEVVAIFERASGRVAKRTRVPDFVLHVASWLTRPVLPAVHRVLALALLPANENDVFDPGPLLARYPMTLTRLEEIAEERAGREPTRAPARR
jgi:NADH dehydrogenase